MKNIKLILFALAIPALSFASSSKFVSVTGQNQAAGLTGKYNSAKHTITFYNGAMFNILYGDYMTRGLTPQLIAIQKTVPDVMPTRYLINPSEKATQDKNITQIKGAGSYAKYTTGYYDKKSKTITFDSNTVISKIKTRTGMGTSLGDTTIATSLDGKTRYITQTKKAKKSTPAA